MSRLIVDAVSAENTTVDVVGDLLICVSVSDGNTGEPVTGLTATNFRLASDIGGVSKITISLCTERMWEPTDTALAGVYELWVSCNPPNTIEKWIPGEYYQFGVQAHITKGHKVISVGQTVVNVKSLGK